MAAHRPTERTNEFNQAMRAAIASDIARLQNDERSVRRLAFEVARVLGLDGDGVYNRLTGTGYFPSRISVRARYCEALNKVLQEWFRIERMAGRDVGDPHDYRRFSRTSSEMPRAQPALPVVAVLPFASDDASDRATLGLLGGFRDHIVSELSKIAGLLITAPDDADRASPTVGTRTVAHYELVGRLLREGLPRGILSIQLVQVNSLPVPRAIRWAATFEVSQAELFEALDTIAARVARALDAALPERPSPTATQARAHSSSYSLFLKAVSLLATNEEADLEAAFALLKHVVNSSPEFADGRALYGYAMWRRYFSGWGGNIDSLDRVREEAHRALDLDDTCTWARMTLIRVYWDFGRHEQAIAEGVRAIQDAPGNIEARLALARALNNAGMADLALPITEEVLSVDPANVTATKLRIWNLLMIGQLDSALAIGSSYIAEHPGDSNTAWAVTMTHALLNNFERAIFTAERSLRADQASFPLWQLLGYVEIVSGDEGLAKRKWEQGIRSIRRHLGPSSTNYRALSYVANMCAAVGWDADAVALARQIEEVEPDNGYLNYRLSHIYAELGSESRAVHFMSRAAECGFLSSQLLRCEERVCALRRLRTNVEYLEVVGNLELRVARTREQYSSIVASLSL